MKSIWDEAYTAAAGCEQDFMQPKGFDEAKLRIRDVMLKAYVSGLREFAWWKDGVEYVGTCGMTLKEAVRRAHEDAAAPPPSE